MKKVILYTLSFLIMLVLTALTFNHINPWLAFAVPIVWLLFIEKQILKLINKNK
jgi:hypothetical protein